ncbi:MAG TPA: hypothetical protein VJP86_02240 [Vicinamibacterales bacterium]|nr:hypothetical protein [Vicinamibacterales bacterium]
MRDTIAALVAIALALAAASLATTLHVYRQRRRRARDDEERQGRTVVAELPTGDDLVLFSEDRDSFHYGKTVVAKDRIVAARVLINGAPIAATLSLRHPGAASRHPTSFEDRPEGIARDRWDVAIETTDGTVLVECGAIRERVSQELARTIYDAVKRAIEAD